MDPSGTCNNQVWGRVYRTVPIWHTGSRSLAGAAINQYEVTYLRGLLRVRDYGSGAEAASLGPAIVRRSWSAC